MSIDLNKNKIIIFGGTSTIAVEIARKFAGFGCTLALVGRDEQSLSAVKNDLSARGANVEILQYDLADIEKLPEIFEKAAAKIGSLDGVVVAHGSLTDQKRAENDLQYLNSEININFISAAAILTKAAELLEAKKSGYIVAISSVAGDRGRQSNYVYGSAKAGLTVFLAGLRNRLAASAVQVLTVKPGFISTKMTANLKQGPLFAPPKIVAKDIIRAIQKGKDVLYTPWFWRCIMLVIKSIPEKIFKKLKL
jgi:decaprenylphospho-beta-D-erythro-pentofuranosid-2-ulose 2-reductase